MLYNKLVELAQSGVYPMHMPGHKRNSGFLPSGLPYSIDITEIHGFDNLLNPRGILYETAGLASELYGSDKAFLLVNGSTVGILATIGAHAGHGDKILMARNCHLSVYNAVALFGLQPTYVLPGTDRETGIARSIDPATIESALELNPDTKLVIITSPTFEGVISDIASIADSAHRRNIPLMVDAAHGAHLGFSPKFVGCAVKAGADIVIMSLHKTLPALTQCALAHVCGERANLGEIERLLSALHTTSPSYVLMASIDSCLRLISSDKDRLFYEYERNLDNFRKKVKSLENLSVLWHNPAASADGFFSHDPGKIIIVTSKTALSGTAVAQILHSEYNIESEMACPFYVVAMTSICDSAEGFSRLAGALGEIDRSITPSATMPKTALSPPLPTANDTPGNALKLRGNPVALENATVRMSLEYIWAYPPGIPIITPGEVIDENIITYISRLWESGVALSSTKRLLPLITSIECSKGSS